MRIQPISLQTIYEGELAVEYKKDHGIIYVHLQGLGSEEFAEQMVASCHKVASEHPNVRHWLIDISGLRTAPIKEERKIIRGFIDEYTSYYFAICGNDTVGSAVVNYVIAAVGYRHVKLFKRQEDAIEWLEKKKTSA